MIDLFFIVLNFAIFVGLIYYAVRRYLVPDLKIKIEQEKATEKSLHDEHRTLLITQKQVEESILTQEENCTAFLAKINQWRNSVTAQRTQREAEERYVYEESEKRLHRQAEYHMLKAMHKNITPFVVKALEDDLKSYFSEERAAQDYVQKVLRDLKK